VTRIGVLAAPGRARLLLTQGPISPRVVRVTDRGASVALVATTALLLGGDHIEIDIEVGPGAWLEVVETAGTVAYDADGAASSWTVRVRLAEDAVLLWAGEPFVVAQGANVRRQTTIEMADRATACLREILVLGRVGETGGQLRSTLSVHRSGEPLVLEDLDLGSGRDLPGVMGSARLTDSVTLLGARAPLLPELAAGNRFDLDGPGTIARYLGSSAAASPMPAISSAWREVAHARSA
jgi:urease accessory protein